MSRFRCGRFPAGEWPIRTSGGIVWFRGGQADVDDPDLAAALREVPAVFGITGDGATEPPADTPEAPERPAQLRRGARRRPRL